MDETTEQAAPETQATAEETTPARILNAHDRCDVRDCNAQAYVRVSLESGALYFCGHDYAKVEALLKATSEQVLDERAFILQR